MKRILVYFSIALFFIFVLLKIIILPSYAIVDSIITKTDELNRLYENWLITRTEVVLFLSLPAGEKEHDRFISRFTSFDLAMETLIDDNIFKLISLKYKNTNKIRETLILEWQKMQFKLTTSNLDEIDETLIDLIHWIANESNGFQDNLKTIINNSTNYRLNRFKNNLLIVYIMTIIILAVCFLLIVTRFQTEKAKQSEDEIKKLSKSLISIRDEERKRIAIDLHDVLVQKLAFIKKRFDRQNEYIKNTDNVGKTEISNELQSAIDITRGISFNLRPIELKENFVEAIKYYCAEISSRHGIDIQTSFLGISALDMPDEIEINLFRLIQEIINNSLKHSEASLITVKLVYSYPYLILMITDNGLGFDVDKILGKKKCREHMGLSGIKDRISLFNGSLSIKSSQAGTKFKIKIPHREKDNAE